jgi:hypothetical protein
MSECDKCGQPLPKSTTILDAIGREIGIYDVLLWLRPATTIHREGVKVIFSDPISLYPVVLYPAVIDRDTADNSFCIKAVTENNHEEAVFGVLGKPNPNLYKIASSVSELP